MALAVHEHFERLGRDHAFGGALALAYYADPRGTVDVDVNVFVGFDAAPQVVDELGAIGFLPTQSQADWLPIAGVALVRGRDPTRLDVFFSIDERYDEVARRARRFPFGTRGARLPFLSAEDLAMFKLSFGRDKDWVDVRRLVESHPELDIDYVERQLIGIRGPTMYPRVARLRAMARVSGPGVHPDPPP